MKLKKGSQAAKNYMAKIRAKRGKVGTPAKKAAPVKKAAPKKAAKAIKTELKAKGLKMPHGYGVETRARVNGHKNLMAIEYAARSLNDLLNDIDELKIKLKAAPATDKQTIRNTIKFKKAQFAALKKYFVTISKFR
jgi:hypothetical protein